jgi:hypothetical protein
MKKYKDDCIGLLTSMYLDAMHQERRVAAIVRSTYEINRGTQVIFLCRRNLAIDINGPYFATGITPKALVR